MPILCTNRYFLIVCESLLFTENALWQLVIDRSIVINSVWTVQKRTKHSVYREVAASESFCLIMYWAYYGTTTITINTNTSTTTTNIQL